MEGQRGKKNSTFNKLMITILIKNGQSHDFVSRKRCQQYTLSFKKELLCLYVICAHRA